MESEKKFLGVSGCGFGWELIKSALYETTDSAMAGSPEEFSSVGTSPSMAFLPKENDPSVFISTQTQNHDARGYE